MSRARHNLLPLLVLLTCAGGCSPLPFLIPDPLDVRVGVISAEHLEANLAGVPRPIPARTQWMVEAFREAGCPAHEIWQIEGTRGTSSIFCTLPGRSRHEVIVAASLDRPDDGRGVIDNGTGMALLPLLYQSLSVEPREHTFVFVAFTDTLISQRGSRSYLRRMGGESRARIRAMVQLKALGVGTSAMWGERAEVNLRQDLFSVSRALEVPLRNVAFTTNVAVDAASFRWWGIPTITVHSLGKKSARVLAQPVRDRHLEAIDWVHYHASARLLATYLAYLDATLELRLDTRKAPKPL